MRDHDHSTRDVPPFLTMTLADLLDAFASSEPVPGGGSAAALAGAVGVSLLIMVAGLPRTRTDAPEEAADLAEASARFRHLRDSLASLIDQDSRAYAEVRDAMRLPKGTDAEKQARRAAIDAALLQAIEVPMETMRCCQQAIRGAVIVATNGHPGSASDTGTGIELLLAGARGAGMNVDINIKSRSDKTGLARIASERRQLESDATSDAKRAFAALAIDS